MYIFIVQPVQIKKVFNTTHCVQKYAQGFEYYQYGVMYFFVEIVTMISIVKTNNEKIASVNKPLL